MGARRIRREQRAADMKESRHRNGIRKSKERTRRDQRMQEILRQSSPPYTPAILSWLSAKLDKPGSKITPEDARQVLA
ncbi:MAG: hypothetical protein ACK4RK_14470 [Gemmataceae bacterium]